MFIRSALILAVFFLSNTIAEAESRYFINVLDIGEGDSILIEDRLEKRALLLDAGSPLAGKKLINSLNDRGIKQLDTVIISHPHLDHFGGLFPLSTAFSVASFYDNGQDVSKISAKEVIYRFYQTAFRQKNYKALLEGDLLKFGEVNLKVLSSSKSMNSNDWNTNSLVLSLTYGDFKMLLPGDGNLETEKYLSEKYCEEINSSVLKAAHHGAGDTASSGFLKCVKPKLTVISVNEKNYFGYPDKGTLQKYRDSGGLVLTTAERGDIILEINTDGSFNIK